MKNLSSVEVNFSVALPKSPIKDRYLLKSNPFDDSGSAGTSAPANASSISFSSSVNSLISLSSPLVSSILSSTGDSSEGKVSVTVSGASATETSKSEPQMAHANSASSPSSY